MCVCGVCMHMCVYVCVTKCPWEYTIHISTTCTIYQKLIISIYGEATHTNSWRRLASTFYQQFHRRSATGNKVNGLRMSHVVCVIAINLNDLVTDLEETKYRITINTHIKLSKPNY